MASAIAGRGGSIKINGTPVTTVAQVDQWSGTLTEVLLDQTALGDLWTSDVPGLQTMTGSLSGNWAVTGDPGQTTLHNAVLNKVTVGLNLLENSTDGYELTAYLSDFATTVATTGKVTFTANFRSQGQVFFT